MAGGPDVEGAPPPAERPGSERPDPVEKQGGGVLFVCTHNSVRSPMAGALYRAAIGPGARVSTAGAVSRGPLDPRAVAAMREVGLDISGHPGRLLHDIEAEGGDVAAFDVVVALSPLAAERAREYGGPGTRVELWPTDDPTGADETALEPYRALRGALEARIRQRFLRARASRRDAG